MRHWYGLLRGLFLIRIFKHLYENPFLPSRYEFLTPVLGYKLGHPLHGFLHFGTLRYTKVGTIMRIVVIRSQGCVNSVTGIVKNRNIKIFYRGLHRTHSLSTHFAAQSRIPSCRPASLPFQATSGQLQGKKKYTKPIATCVVWRKNSWKNMYVRPLFYTPPPSSGAHALCCFWSALTLPQVVPWYILW